MRKRLEKEFFPFVIKPGRYAGGEPGQIVKSPEGRLKYVHAFPDKYEIGHSYPGLQTLYHLVNNDDRFLCERTFSPDRDAELVLRQKGLPLFSLESYRPLNQFDVIGFTLTYELVYTNVLNILDLAGIPLLSNERTDKHPIVIAGGPAVYNPEPMADFIDLFFIGDAEAGLPEILSVLHNVKERGRQGRLEAAVKNVTSVYVPSFYDADGKPHLDFVPARIKARIEPELKPEFYPDRPLVPLIETVHRHLAVEIMRGCPQGCRFCQAGPIYRPVRARKPMDVTRQVETQLSHTGDFEITLLSLSTTDYPEIEQLAGQLAQRLENKRTSVALPSLRPGSVTPRLLDAVKKVRKPGLTLSPEAGTERLRLFLRKDFPDAAVYDTVQLAFERGWTTLKLYYMIGLPTETDEDLLGIVDMLAQIHELSRRTPGHKTINVTLSPFVPKPHTPFQWDEMQSPELLAEKIKFIKKQNRVNQINFKYQNLEGAILQSVIGRGDKQIGHIILRAFRKGSRFDSWSDEFDYAPWKEALAESGINVTDYLRPLSFSAVLPWRHIDKGVSVEHLREERQRTSFQLKEFVPSAEAEFANGSSSSAEFGRNKKKVVSRQTTAPTKNRLRLHWGKTGRLRYMGHLDNMRLLERIFRTSNLPVQYSQGFNPTMKLSFGPPLPLGFTSEAEYIDVTLETNFMPYMAESLRKALPEGLALYETGVVLGNAASISSLLNRAVYSLELNKEDLVTDLEDKMDEIMASSSFEIEREHKGEIKRVDIRPAIYGLTSSDSVLEMTLGVGDGGYVKPFEILELLFGFEMSQYLAFRTHRKKLYRLNEQGEKIMGMDL